MQEFKQTMKYHKESSITNPYNEISFSVLTFLSLLLIAMFLFSSVLLDNREVKNWLVIISFTPVVFISAFMIVYDIRWRPFSLNLVHLLFIFIFFGIAPIIQYMTNSLRFAFYSSITDSDIMVANIVVTVWIIFYVLKYYAKTPTNPRLVNMLLHRHVSYKGLLLGLLFSSILLLLFWKKGNYNTWMRAVASFDMRSGPATLIVSIFGRAIPIVTLAAVILIAKQGSGRYKLGLSIAAIVLIVGNILFNNPFSAPRYWTATVFIGFLSIVVLRKFKNGVLMVFCFIGGVFFILPLLNIGRVYTSTQDAIAAARFTNPVYALQSGDFDAYANVIHTFHYIQMNGITWGKQLLGALFFFIPRSFWPGKPVGSGHLIAPHFDFPNFNIGTPPPAEAIINFGILGIPIFAVIFGHILRLLDDCYICRLKQMDTSKAVVLIDVLYPFWIGLVFLISRGDLMSSLAYTVGFTLAGLPLILFAKSLL